MAELAEESCRDVTRGTATEPVTNQTPDPPLHSRTNISLAFQR
jgi:hypothetical protein